MKMSIKTNLHDEWSEQVDNCFSLYMSLCRKSLTRLIETNKFKLAETFAIETRNMTVILQLKSN